MARKQFNPKTKDQSDLEITRKQRTFNRGMMSGPPASELPEGAVARLVNAVAYPKWLQGRYGSNIYTENGFPVMVGMTNLDGTRADDVLTSPDASFDPIHVGNIWIWDDGDRDTIIDYISATQVRLSSSGTKSGHSCRMQGKHNGWFFHKEQKIVLLHLGTDFWVSDTIALNTWTRVLCKSYDEPSNAVSDFDEFGDEVCVFNSNGIYRVFVGAREPYAYRLNTPTPAVYISDNIKTDTLPYGYRYIYTAMRLSGVGNLRGRADSGVVIETESGPNQLDDNLKDYGEVWSESRRGNNTRIHGVLTGPVVANANLDAVGLWAPVTNGTMTISINGTSYNVWVDFTGVQTMNEVAARIQLSLRIYWPDATCAFDANRFVVTSGYVNNTNINSIAAGVGGTDITVAGYTNLILGVIDNTTIFASPLTLSQLRVPVLDSDPDSPHWHWTHFGVYRTLDVGANGTDPVTGTANNPQRFIWEYDLRIGAAFLATRDLNGIVTASVGEFELPDVGSTLEWDDGDRDLITEYISSTQVRVGETGGYSDDLKTAACALGNGRVVRAYQSRDIVNATAGSSFTASDVRKTIFWAQGDYSHITEFISATQVRVSDETERQDQGLTLEPLRRNYHDSIDDEVLRPRISGYTIKNRGWSALPLTNMGRVTPGWIFTAVRGEGIVYYQQLNPEQKYLTGYHAGDQLNDEIKDAIQAIHEFPNRIIFYCVNSVYGAPTNTSVQIKVAGTGEFINILTGIQILDNNLGVIDYGSIQYIDIGRQMMRTNDNAIRVFDGFKFSGNLAEDSEGNELIMNEIRELQNATASGFRDGEYFIWGLR